MKRFVFLTVFVGCFITSQAYASFQGNIKILPIFWVGENGEQLVQVPYNPLTVTLRSLKKKISKMIRIPPMKQTLTAVRPVMVKSFRYRESTPLNKVCLRDAQHLQEILASPGVSVTLQQGLDERRSITLDFF